MVTCELLLSELLPSLQILSDITSCVPWYFLQCTGTAWVGGQWKLA